MSSKPSRRTSLQPRTNTEAQTAGWVDKTKMMQWLLQSTEAACRHHMEGVGWRCGRRAARGRPGRAAGGRAMRFLTRRVMGARGTAEWPKQSSGDEPGPTTESRHAVGRARRWSSCWNSKSDLQGARAQCRDKHNDEGGYEQSNQEVLPGHSAKPSSSGRRSLRSAARSFRAVAACARRP